MAAGPGHKYPPDGGAGAGAGAGDRTGGGAGRPGRPLWLRCWEAARRPLPPFPVPVPLQVGGNCELHPPPVRPPPDPTPGACSHEEEGSRASGVRLLQPPARASGLSGEKALSPHRASSP